MALFAGIGTALKTSAMARWIAGGAAALVTALTWLALHDAKVRKIERLKAAERTRKAAEKALKQIQENNDERIEASEKRAERIRNRPPSDGERVDELPEHLRSILVSNAGNPDGGSGEE